MIEVITVTCPTQKPLEVYKAFGGCCCTHSEREWHIATNLPSGLSKQGAKTPLLHYHPTERQKAAFKTLDAHPHVLPLIDYKLDNIQVGRHDDHCYWALAVLNIGLQSTSALGVPFQACDLDVASSAKRVICVLLFGLECLPPLSPPHKRKVLNWLARLWSCFRS